MEISVIGNFKERQSILAELFGYLKLPVPSSFTIGKTIGAIIPPETKPETKLSYMYWQEIKAGYATNIFVPKPARRQHIASTMSDYYINELKANGITTAYCYLYSPLGLQYMTALGYHVVFENRFRKWMCRTV